MLPPGEHISYECSWSADGEIVTLWCPLHTADLHDLGVFEVKADGTTQFVVDDISVPSERALERYGRLWGDTVLVADEPGHLTKMLFRTRGA